MLKIRVTIIFFCFIYSGLKAQENIELFDETKIPGFLKPAAKKGMGMLERLQTAELEYRSRLEKIVEGPIIPYPDDWDEFSLEIPLKTLDPLGLILTEARQPNLHFPEVES